MHKFFLGYIALLIFPILLISCTSDKKDIVEEEQFVDLVYPLLDTENSRWFFFSSANRPFGMVNLSPDTKIKGAWGSGYRYEVDTIKGFSHIHAWQMSGLSVMPVTTSSANSNTVYTNYYSKFDHNTEKIVPGYHSVFLNRYGIQAELTSTKRVGFHRYSFPESKEAAILFNLNTVLGPCENVDGTLQKDSDYELSGNFEMAPTTRRPKPLQVFFKIILDQPIASLQKDGLTGNYLLKLRNPGASTLMKVGISYTSVENASFNIQEELTHWDFDKIVSQSKAEWNQWLSRIEVEGGTVSDRRRFYTDLWHALQGRRIISDANGAYPDNTGEHFKIGQLPLNKEGKPEFNHYNSDSFWGAQWTINTLWGLVYPEIMEEFVHSLMQYHKDGGLIPRGPSGGDYTFVMTGASSTPFIVSAIQKGLVKNNLGTIYQALKKNHLPGGIMGKVGYEHSTQIGGGLKYYLENGYVPYPIPEGKFGLHQDGASQTLEYAYQDWTLAQLAKKLGMEEDYTYFLSRSENYKNVFDKNIGWVRPKNLQGNWLENFDPYQYEHGFVESNAAQATWFVPHDVAGLAQLMGGKEKAVEKLNNQFKIAQELNFTSGTSHEAELHPEYSRIPINFGNQPSIQTSFIFNLLDRPDLTQYWTRKVIEKTFSGLSTGTGYNGDEDQGLMGSLNVLLKIGLFQMNGGTEENPSYQIGSPLFKKITLKLNPDYYTGKTFVIKAPENSKENIYITKIELNHNVLNGQQISHDDITKGGELLLEMSSQSN